jgi:phosphoglycerate kinase
MRDEINAFTKLLTIPERPVAAIIGGAKLSTKISVLFSLLSKVDKLLIGGAMVFTFYRALELTVGDSLYEESRLEVFRSIIQEASKQNVKLILASDCVVAE